MTLAFQVNVMSAMFFFWIGKRRPLAYIYISHFELFGQEIYIFIGKKDSPAPRGKKQIIKVASALVQSYSVARGSTPGVTQ